MEEQQRRRHEAQEEETDEMRAADTDPVMTAAGSITTRSSGLFRLSLESGQRVGRGGFSEDQQRTGRSKKNGRKSTLNSFCVIVSNTRLLEALAANQTTPGLQAVSFHAGDLFHQI